MADALMLGVSGMRGIVGSTLTPEVATRFAGTVGAWVRSQPKRGSKTQRPMVVLARDGRAAGVAIRNAVAAGVLASGCDVLDLGVATTPTCGVATDLLGDAGLVITASHNPQPWNGIKVIDGGPGAAKRPCAAAPTKAVADRIIAAFAAGPAAACAWDGVGEEMVDEAGFVSFAHSAKITGLLAELGVLKRIKAARLPVVLDSVNASGVVVTPTLLKKLGCRLTHVGDQATGIFPHAPEPTEANLRGLGRTVRAKRAAIGLAQDPDADRLALLDERGRYIGEEYTLVLAARALIELGVVKRGAAIAVNLSTSRMIDDLAARHGVKVIRTAVGEANVVEAMKSRRCVLGGEGNGGVIWPAVTYIRDSLGAMSLVLALLAITKRSLSELVDEMPRYAIVKRKVDLARRSDAGPGVERIAAAYRAHRVDRQDGVRVDFADRCGGAAWVHVRASNTEPIMRLIAEAPTRAAAESLLEEVAGVTTS